MEKVSKFLTFILISSMFFSACEKENDLQTKTEIAVTEITTSSGIKLKKANLSIYDLLKNPEDTQDEAMFYNLYYLASGYLDFASDNNINLIIQNEILQTKNNEIKLDKLFESSLLKSSKNNSAIQVYQSLIKSTTSLMLYNDINYYPGLYVLNSEIANFELSPIIAMGTDICADNEALEDHIPAWYIDEDGTKIEILLDQSTSETIANPVLIFTNNTDYEYNANTDKLYSSQNFKSTQGINSIPVFTQYKITNRYERSGRSEYKHSFTVLWNDGTTKKSGWVMKIRNIRKRDIGKLFSNQYLKVPVNGVASWFVTYEDDWYASRKDVTVTDGPHSEVVRCRMKYKDEWYQKFFLDFKKKNNVTVNSKGTVTVSFK